jgi:uncharacterized damage-inducible protein DinB
MQVFFISAFEFDFQQNKELIAFVEKSDLTMNPEIRKHICHIINAHYIWLQRLDQQKIESDLWDDLPFYSWEKLTSENAAQTHLFVMNHDLASFVSYEDEGAIVTRQNCTVLYHILQHSVHHRAIIYQLLKENGSIYVGKEYIDWQKT